MFDYGALLLDRKQDFFSPEVHRVEPHSRAFCVGRIPRISAAARAGQGGCTSAMPGRLVNEARLVGYAQDIVGG